MTTRLIKLFIMSYFITNTSIGNAEIVLRILTWQGYTPETMVKTFKEKIKNKYDEDLIISVKYVSHSDEFFDHIRNETVDIIAPSHNIILDERYQLINKRLLLPIDLKNIPNYSNIIPSLQYAPYTTIGGQVYSVPMLHGPYGLIYDTKKLSQPPSTWKALWDQEYKGQYAISYDYLEANIYVTALALGVPRNKITDIDTLKDFGVPSALIKLVDNADTLWRGVDTPEDLSNSKIAASWGFSLTQLKKQNKYWKMAEPIEGVTGWVDGYAITNTLKNKPKLKLISEEWINFCISNEVQHKVVVEQLGSNPVNTQIKDNLTQEQIEKAHFNNLNYFKEQRILWPLLTRRQRNYFKSIWDQALRASKKNK